MARFAACQFDDSCFATRTVRCAPGLNPLTGRRVFSADHIRNVLPLMTMAGMYDYSGQWAYDIGVRHLNTAVATHPCK